MSNCHSMTLSHSQGQSREIGSDGIGTDIDVLNAPIDRNLPYIPFEPKAPK